MTRGLGADVHRVDVRRCDERVSVHTHLAGANQPSKRLGAVQLVVAHGCELQRQRVGAHQTAQIARVEAANVAAADEAHADRVLHGRHTLIRSEDALEHRPTARGKHGARERSLAGGRLAQSAIGVRT